MKKYLQVAVVAVMALGVSAQAHAGLLEIRGGVGINSPNRDSFDDRVSNINGEHINRDKFDNYNADVFFNLPGLPFGVGLRQEWLKNKTSSGDTNREINARVTSVIADWRILNNVVYLGPIVGIGYPNAEVKYHSGSSDGSDHVKSGRPSYSVGAEAGVKLGMFIIGAEAGYSSLKLKSFESNDVHATVDLSGMYGKAMVGLTFL